MSHRVSSFSLSFVGGMAHGYVSPYFPPPADPFLASWTKVMCVWCPVWGAGGAVGHLGVGATSQHIDLQGTIPEGQSEFGGSVERG